ncbi:MAG: 30S ribosomal protein S13 [Candidatus Bathyarchaeota archaeon]|nr:30S ribosomal protein S13 [Candidatus Bathyarchaeum tardum]WGM89594.1 MAG: 30S ribosomal protein S13 [Candidatus Bathyarchaeum tardum]WNZ30303.1 MAG: 30S ribosomal protein S13 [Candidatus Bathyarchaeota archaeon]
MSREFQHIIRFAGADIQGSQPVTYALTNVKGIGIKLATVIVEKSGIDPEQRMGFLSSADVAKIEDVITNPNKYGIPAWLLNRRKDMDTGKNLHLLGTDLIVQTKNDIDGMKAIRSWKGFRHSYGLKVRGQRTKSTGREGKAMGVKRKQVQRGGK